MKKAKISGAATLQNKNCSRNFTQKYYKINLFCEKKQDFSAAKTPQHKLMFFYKDTSPLDNISLKKEIKNAQTN